MLLTHLTGASRKATTINYVEIWQLQCPATSIVPSIQGPAKRYSDLDDDRVEDFLWDITQLSEVLSENIVVPSELSTPLIFDRKLLIASQRKGRARSCQRMVSCEPKAKATLPDFSQGPRTSLCYRSFRYYGEGSDTCICGKESLWLC